MFHVWLRIEVDAVGYPDEHIAIGNPIVLGHAHADAVASGVDHGLEVTKGCRPHLKKRTQPRPIIHRQPAPRRCSSPAREHDAPRASCPWAFLRSAGKGSFSESFFYALHIRKANPTPCICAPPSRLSVPRGKPRKDPRRDRRKRKLPRPKRLLPKAATRRGKCGTGAGASLRASALPCVSPPQQLRPPGA